MLSNGVRYSVEFIKLILVTTCIFDIKVKRSINVLFGISLIGVIITSYWLNISDYSIAYALIAFAIFLVALYEKRNIGFVVLSYIGISIIDMLFVIVCINAFHLTLKQLENEIMLSAALNSFSLVFIIVFSIILKRTKRKKIGGGFNVYVPVFILGGLALSMYLTYIQFVGLEKEYKTYQNGLVISAIAITIIYSLICYLLIEYRAKTRCLQMENDMNQKLLKAQNDYYSMMLKKETETKMFRHDIKEHIMCIQMLYDQKKYSELGEYLSQMDTYTKELSPKVATGNVYIDMILADLSEQFPDVIIEWIGKMPQLSIASMDICTLFYNLLKNAFESAHRVSDKSVKVIIKMQGTNLMIIVTDYYDNLKQDNDSKYLTTKREKGHGYGIKNIENCVEKYKGSYMVTTENRLFCTEIILPDVISEK